MARVLVWGAGELGGRVARAAAANGDAVTAVTRTPTRHAELRAAGIEPVLAEQAAARLADADTLLMAVPGSAAQQAAVVALAAFPAPARVVFVSSTGYYGQPSGGVDEETPAGTDAHAAEIAGAEQMFRAWAGAAGVVVRLGGLYRPGRGPMSALQQRGSAPLGPPDRTLALIHYEDAATACLAALRHPNPAPTYLGVTPPCPTRHDFYLAASVLLGLESPLFDRKLGRPLADYDVTRLRRDLLPTPAHPRWQEALLLLPPRK